MTKKPNSHTSPRNRLGSLGHILLDAGVSVTENPRRGRKGNVTSKNSKEVDGKNKTESRANCLETPQLPSPKSKVKPKPNKKKKGKRGKQSKSRARSEKGKRLLAIIDRQEKRKERGEEIRSESILGQGSSPPQPDRHEDPYSISAVQKQLDEISSRMTLSEDYSEATKGNASDSLEINRRMEACRELVAITDTCGSQEKELVVGFDMGSTSSKVVLQFPYEASLGAFAVPAPASLQSDNHPYYWKSCIWVSQDGTYQITPSDDAKVISHLKVAFLNSDQSSKAGILPEQIHMTAFLALMIRQALGWLWERIGRALTGYDIRISANFGFPSQSGDRSPVLTAYERSAKTALWLALSDRRITDEEIRNLLNEDTAGQLKVTYPVLVVPEFIGAVMGYFHSTQGKSGQYIICDFGGLTMDCVCFGFSRREDGAGLIKFYGSSVRTFGAEIVKTALKQRIPKNKIATAIGNFICQPIIASFPKTGHNAPAWGGRMPLFVIGGGRHLGAYKNCFSEAQRLVKNAWFNTVFSRQDLNLDEELAIDEAKGRNCGRLLVAWGLSHSDLDLPEWVTRDGLPDAPKLKKASLQDRFVGPEQT
ncbi:hypothetical protein K3718_10040 [Leisingera aquaemixtae]|uniref:Uncharacterized protein n=1 Tax=Leisingera aquaemixtae TaxID=1396826 RepID=A0ABY5WEQ9_9RHOB|nr:hypothetical protein [Leisingera aquaemixtae]UWQ39928.1 hypothetical protein K3718_10040 [Leisingera aquaemixtae]